MDGTVRMRSEYSQSAQSLSVESRVVEHLATLSHTLRNVLRSSTLAHLPPISKHQYSQQGRYGASVEVNQVERPRNRVDVDIDVLLGVLHLQEEELGDDEGLG